LSSVAVWGQTALGDDVHRVFLARGPMRAEVITLGACLRDLRLNGHLHPLVLGLNSVADYELDTAYLGAVVGRFANRIAGARLNLDGVDYKLEANENGNMLHGGGRGFSSKVWQIENVSAHAVTLLLDSPDGDMGFPGRLSVRCTYALDDAGTLGVTFLAEAEAPTICSLAQHTYFNLQDGGSSSIHAHELQFSADAYLPVNALLIPAGAPTEIEHSWIDFRKMREVGSLQIDHNVCLSQTRVPLRPVARLACKASGIEMEVATTEPGLQIYTGDGLDDVLPGLEHKSYGSRSGIALETQVWPDAPNRPEFPSALLRPGEVLRQVTEFRFKKS